MTTRRWLIVAFAMALVALGVFYLSLGNDDEGATGVPSDYPYPAQAIPLIDDRSHFPLDQTYSAYNSNPPTSGPHALQPAQWGISDIGIPKEVLVHNMEHAGAVVWYNCNAGGPLSSEACGDLRNQLGAVVQPELGAGQRVVMSPYPDMPHRIALTSWGILDEFDEFDGQRVKLFIDTFECAYDPEHFCR